MTLNETTSISRVASNAMQRQCVLPWPPTFNRNSPATTNNKRSKESSRPTKQQSKRHRQDTENNNNNNNNSKGNQNERNNARSLSSPGHRREADQHRISPTVEVINETKATSTSARSNSNSAVVKENYSSTTTVTNRNQAPIVAAAAPVPPPLPANAFTPFYTSGDASVPAANNGRMNRPRSGSVSSKGTSEGSDMVHTHRQAEIASTEAIYYIEDI
jgi:hypothetical protein